MFTVVVCVCVGVEQLIVRLTYIFVNPILTQPLLLPFTSHHPAYPGPQQLITVLLSVLSPILFQPNLLSWTTELRDDLESKVMGLLEFQGPSPCEGLACFDPNTYPYIKQAGSCIGCEAFLDVKIGQLRSRLVKIFQDRYK